MSLIGTLRLSQFYRLRIQPLIEQLPPAGEDHDEFIAAYFEAVGWLNEGVFCGYFDSRESDVLWTNLSQLRDHCGGPTHGVVPPSLATEISKLYASHDPFRESHQMPDGAQKAFELPLFQHALAAADRWAGDKLASYCCSFLYGNRRLSGLNILDPKVRPSSLDVERALLGDGLVESDSAKLLAGFIKTLEHMESSRSFFEYARGKSNIRIDFNSYRQRIGTLNAWRVPLYRDNASRKLEDLLYLLESTLRSIMRASGGEDWSSVEAPLRKHYESLIESWSNDHLIAFFELA